VLARAPFDSERTAGQMATYTRCTWARAGSVDFEHAGAAHRRGARPRWKLAFAWGSMTGFYAICAQRPSAAVKLSGIGRGGGGPHSVSAFFSEPWKHLRESFRGLRMAKTRASAGRAH